MLSVKATDFNKSKASKELRTNAQRQIIDEALKREILIQEATGEPIEEIVVDDLEFYNLTKAIKEEIIMAGFKLKPHTILPGFTIIVKSK